MLQRSASGSCVSTRRNHNSTCILTSRADFRQVRSGGTSWYLDLPTLFTPCSFTELLTRKVPSEVHFHSDMFRWSMYHHHQGVSSHRALGRHWRGRLCGTHITSVHCCWQFFWCIRTSMSAYLGVMYLPQHCLLNRHPTARARARACVRTCARVCNRLFQFL
jgi:hypothetical protein